MPGPLELRSPFWWLRWVPAVVLTVLLLQLLYVAARVAIVPVLACPSPKFGPAGKSLISQLRSGDNPGSMITVPVKNSTCPSPELRP